MNQSSYIKITVTRKDDGSLFYHHMKNFEKIKTYVAVDASISNNQLHFHSSGQGYMFELDKWNVSMSPVF